MNKLLPLLAALAFFFTTSQSIYAEPTLAGNAYLYSCPFYRLDNNFESAGVVSAVNQLIEQKIDIREKCRAPLNQLQSTLSATDILLQQQSVDDRNRILQDLYSRFRSDMKARLAALELAGAGSSQEAIAIEATIAQSYSQELSSQNSSYYDIANYGSNELQFRTQLYGNFQQLVQTIRTLDSQDCLDAVGGAKTLASPVLKIAAMATGFSGMAAAGVVTTVLDLASNVTYLLADRKLHRAKSEMDRVENDQMIACTYYALKYSACEYKYAKKIAADKSKVLAILRGEINSSPRFVSLSSVSSAHPEYTRLVFLKSRIELFSDIFNSVLSQGTSLSMDSTLLTSYITASLSRPNEIIIPTFNLSIPAEQARAQAWLNDMRLRGISFSTMEINGSTIPLQGQIDSAIADIGLKQRTLTTAEATIREKLAFTDVRNRLNKIPGVRRIINESLQLMADFISGPYTSVVSNENKSALLAAQELIELVKKFLEIDPMTVAIPCGPTPLPAPGSTASNTTTLRLQCYEAELNRAGNELFLAMSRGAIGAIARQTVVIVPEKAVNRIRSAADVIENAFLRDDLDASTNYENSYASVRDQERMTSLILRNYSDYAIQKPFDESRYQVAFSSMEKAFAHEIKRMILRAAKRDRTLFNQTTVNEDNQDRLSQLCSLFASSLPQIKGGSDLLAMCKANAKNVRLLEVISPDPLAINYDDPCFLPNYQRLLTIQNLVVKQLQEPGIAQGLR